MARATVTSPANILLIVKQSYKSKKAITFAQGSQLIVFTLVYLALFLGTLVNGLYLVSNSICIRIVETNQIDFIPLKYLSSIETTTTTNVGQILSSIGPCHFNIDLPVKSLDLSRQISNISLHAKDMLNVTPVLEKFDVETCSSRIRIVRNYERQFIGDISVLESEIVTLVKLNSNSIDWTYVRRGDGRQGFIPSFCKSDTYFY